MRTQPKKNIVSVKFVDKIFGNELRESYTHTIYENEKNFPKPLEYKDIDLSFEEFVEKELNFTGDNGVKIPTFTLYSNQRFNEYSQTWRHTDENGNLLMNFKTISRDNNPKVGTNQGNYWNIPGNRYYTIFRKTVLDDNGREHIEVYSMKQPYCVDLTYKVNFVTNTFEKLNEFNQRVNELFKSRNFYIRPNGHYIPMVIEDISDETSYTIEDRKFFVQSVSIKAMAYIIKEDDFKITKFPKTAKIYPIEKKSSKLPKVEVEEYDKAGLRNIEINIKFDYCKASAEFTIDTDADIERFETENIRSVRVSINGTPWFIDRGFKMHNGDVIRVKARMVRTEDPAKITFIGTIPNTEYDKTEKHESVKDEPIVEEIIDIV